MTYWNEEDRLRFAVKPRTSRLSAGIEEKNKLIADLERALSRIFFMMFILDGRRF